MYRIITFVAIAALCLMFPALAPSSSATLADAVASPALSASVVGLPTNTSTVFVPKGTIIVVQTLQGLSSYAAHPGEKIHYVVTSDVILNGYMIAQAGDTAEGEVQEAHEGKNNAWTGERSAGDLRVSVDKVFNFCADSIETVFDRVEYRRSQGVFGSNADVQIIKGQKYAAIVGHPQKVCGSKTNATPAPISSDVIRSGIQPGDVQSPDAQSSADTQPSRPPPPSASP